MKICIVVTCMGRAMHLKQSLPLFLGQDYPADLFKVVVVNWSSPDDLEDYLDTVDSPNLVRVKVDGKQNFHLAAARNAGAEHAIKTFDPHLIFFTDADILLPKDFLVKNVVQYAVLKDGTEEVFLHWKYLENKCFDIWGSVMVPACEWAKWRYNEEISTYGHEDNEFYNCLRCNGCVNKPLLVEGVTSIKHDDALRMKYYKESPEQMRQIRQDNRAKFRFKGFF